MTESQKTTTKLTLASLVAAVILIGSAWPSVSGFLEWIAPIFGRDQVQAVLAATAGGLLFGVPLPHFLPHSWTPARTRMVSGLLCSAVTFAVAIALVSTRTGLVYAFLAAVANPTVSQAVSGALYWLKPCAKPESLQP